MPTTLNTIAPVFFVIIIGHLLSRYKFVARNTWLGVEHLCFYVLLPALIVREVSRAELTGAAVGGAVATFATGVAVMALALLAFRPMLMLRCGLSGPAFTSLFQGATRWHGFMALGIAGPLYGGAGVALCSLILGAMVPFIQFINVGVLMAFGDNGAALDLRSLSGRMATNPLIIASVSGLALNYTGVPDTIFKTLDIIGSGGLGLTLLSAGAALSFGRTAEARALVAAGVLTRLVGMPALLLLVAWGVGLHGATCAVTVAAGAVPTASTAYVMAQQMGGDAELMASIMTFQMLAATVTLPLFLYLAENM
jgi:malonate transporter